MEQVKFIGMDVHKKSITVAVADGGSRDPARVYGAIDNDPAALDKFCRKMVPTANELRFVYEAGACGYGICRHLTGRGFDCVVAAPSMIPKKTGRRIKTDRRDAQMLASLHRAGELTAVYVPDAEDEAVRDLSRAREDAVFAARKAKQRLHAFLLRHSIVYAGKARWSKAHFNWISDIAMPHAAQQIVPREYTDSVRENLERVERLTGRIRETAENWRLAPVAEALQAARGVSLIVAATILSEIGDLARFEHPQELMAYLGLVPSEHSSGGSVKRGGIAKTGNGHARRAPIEAAWAYRMKPRVGRAMPERQENLPDSVRRIAWKAQLRLCAKFGRMTASGKACQVAVAAVARELCGFLWAMAKQVKIPA